MSTRRMFLSAVAAILPTSLLASERQKNNSLLVTVSREYGNDKYWPLRDLTFSHPEAIRPFWVAVRDQVWCQGINKFSEMHRRHAFIEVYEGIIRDTEKRGSAVITSGIFNDYLIRAVKSAVPILKLQSIEVEIET